MNMIDPFHMEAYGKMTVNYNRDVEIFPVLNAMMTKIMDSCPYKSPTDMGVNMAGNCIVDNAVCEQASKQEIIRRYFSAGLALKKGDTTKETVSKIELLMRKLNITVLDRAVVKPALEKEAITGMPSCALELNDGRIVVGKTGDLLGASSSALLNALKSLAGIEKGVDIISSTVIEPVQKLKVGHMGSTNPRLHTDEVLICLAVSAATDPTAKLAMEQLNKLKGAQLHSSVVLSHVDNNTFKKLGVNVTCEPKRETEKLYNKN
jgi:uncharacterized protein (UPF0371 family)